jgi:predicted nuclease with TOPRIM domain
MAIPGAILFTLLGTSAQFLLNALDNYRLQYIFQHEDAWLSNRQPIESSSDAMSLEDTNPKVKTQIEEYEDKFAWLQSVGIGKRDDGSRRIKRLRAEIERLDEMISKVDREISSLEIRKGES